MKLSKTSTKCYFSSKDGVLRSVVLTERMILRSFEPAIEKLRKNHTQLVGSLYCDPKIMKLVEGHKPYTKKQLDTLVNTWAKTWVQGNPASAWLAFERPSHIRSLDKYLNASQINQNLEKFIGVFMLDPSFSPGTLELGYVLDSNKWKMGYGQEGAHALIHQVIKEINAKNKKYHFDFSFGLASKPVSRVGSVFATSSIENTASIKILDSLKFKPFPWISESKQKQLFGRQIQLKKISTAVTSVKRTLGVRKGIPKYFFLLQFPGTKKK